MNPGLGVNTEHKQSSGALCSWGLSPGPKLFPCPSLRPRHSESLPKQNIQHSARVRHKPAFVNSSLTWGRARRGWWVFCLQLGQAPRGLGPPNSLLYRAGMSTTACTVVKAVPLRDSCWGDKSFAHFFTRRLCQAQVQGLVL